MTGGLFGPPLCAAAGLPQGLRITTHMADVSDFAQIERSAMGSPTATPPTGFICCFNKAGIGGGGSLIVNRCEEWERTFNVCWGSVDDGTRALPTAVAEG
jgi:hypothetical protein